MIYFLLPRTYLYTYQYLEYIDAPNGGIVGYYPFKCDNSNISYISNSLSYYLTDIKDRIHKHENEWDVYKKYTNPYEYIHSNIPCKKRGISKHKPLSRSYFKMVEIVHFFNLFSVNNTEIETEMADDGGGGCGQYNKFITSFGKKNEIKPKFYGGGGEITNKTNDNSNVYQAGWRNTRTTEEGTGTGTGNRYVKKTANPFYGCYVSSSAGYCDTPTPPYNFRKSNTDTKNHTKQWGTSISPPIRTFHLAEGPGGFIEAILQLRNNPLDKYVGMTILDDKHDYNIPSWKKSSQFLKDHYNNVFIENGIDKTGNILSFSNFVYCKNKYGSTMDFITADGGFDFSVDFKNQENNIVRLLFAQIAYAVCMQKQNGHFILKIFDSFMIHTVDLLYLLSSFYENVYICKPQTSRVANSEKYLVCKNFLFSSSDNFYPYFHNCFEKMVNTQLNIDVSRGFFRQVGRFLNIPISNIFITKIEEYNSIFGQQQIENIYGTLSLIETNFRNEKIDMLIKNNIQKCIQWCIKYNVPYNLVL